MRLRSLSVGLCLSLLLAFLVGPSPAGAVNVAHDRVVSPDPADWTPWVNNGRVYALARIGDTMYVGGTFTHVQTPNGTTYARRYLFAFDLRTGAISTSFKPGLDGPVNALATDGASLFVGGAFSIAVGEAHRGLVALTPSGAAVPGFAAAITAGTEVDDLVVANDVLYVAGSFTQVSGAAHAGLAAVDPSSGTPVPGVSVNFTGLHNNGTSHVARIDVSPDGTILVAIGNFTTVGGQPREQMAMLDLTPTTATLSSWSTTRFVMQCSGKFDTYLRDVDIDPTGTYVVVGATGAFYGGANAGTLCDSVSRWELGRTGTGQQPTWVDYAGGDTTWSVTATGTAIYTGGHFRWYNNPYVGDAVGPGTIKRRAIAALDPVNGMPLPWNPGRSPGEGVFIMISTPEGLWVGDDTNQIAGEYHPRLAFFPISGGTTPPVQSAATLPGELYSLPPGGCPSVDPTILYRINAGGPALPSPDCGPDWMADTASTSPYRTSGSATASYDLVTWVDGSVPRSAPAALFSTERYDPSGGDEMVWNLPVPPGRHVRVRLYLSDRCPCTYTAGKRVFDVTLDGTTVLNDWDANAMVGHNTATVRSFDVTSDGSITIGFIHQVENPTVDAIEVIDLDANPVSPTPMPWIAHRSFDGATAGGRVQRSSSIDWSRARGIFFTNGSVYYGWDDGKMYRRTFNGSTFGGSKLVATDDLSPSHFPIPSVTGMFLQDGRLYYTVQGDDRLYYRYFELGGNRVGAVTFVADGPGSAFDWGSVRGVTLAGGTLFLARANGTLWSADWEPGLEHGTPVSASLALVDDDPSQGWASRGLFVQNP